MALFLTLFFSVPDDVTPIKCLPFKCWPDYVSVRLYDPRLYVPRLNDHPFKCPRLNVFRLIDSRLTVRIPVNKAHVYFLSIFPLSLHNPSYVGNMVTCSSCLPKTRLVDRELPFNCILHSFVYYLEEYFTCV